MITTTITSTMTTTDINDLFLKLWRNVVIKNEILMHLKLYNLNSTKLFEISNISDLMEYSNDIHKEYITSIVLKSFNEDNKKLIMDNLSKQVDHLTIVDNFGYGDNNNINNGYDKNDKLKQFTNGFIPNNITHLSICLDDHNYQITNQTFPIGLKYLSLGYNYDLQIQPNVLPQSLTRLRIPKTCKSKLEIGSLPNGLLILEIGNQDTTTIINNNNDEVSILPSSLHSIYFNFGYNRLFNSNSFSSCNSLTYLNFQTAIEQPLSKDWLPVTLETLIIRASYKFPQPVISLPNSIKEFTINGSLTSYNDNGYQLPDSLKKFTFEGTLKGISLPNTLEKLKYKGYDSNLLFSNGFLPVGLKELTLNCITTQDPIYPIGLIKLSRVMSIKQLSNLPQSIEIIKFSYGFSGVITVGLLSNLNSLNSIKFNKGSPYIGTSDSTIFPNSLKHLENYVNSTQKVKTYTGLSNLKTLILPKDFTPFCHPRFPSDNYLPNFNGLQIQSLKFCTGYNVDYYHFKLPQSLTLLDIEFTSSKDLTITGLPKSLTTLIIRDGDNITFPVSSITTSLKSIVFIKPGISSVVYELIKIPEFFKIIQIIQNTQLRDKLFQKKATLSSSPSY